MVNEESRSDFNPTDEESVSTYSVISELEGVGPPTILQYVKESTRVKRTVPAPKPLSERSVLSFSEKNRFMDRKLFLWVSIAAMKYFTKFDNSYHRFWD